MLKLLPLFMLVVPLGACLLIALGSNPKKTSLGAAILNLFLGFILAVNFPYTLSNYQYVTNIPWVQFAEFFQFNFHIGLDGINFPLILLTLIVTVSSIAVAPENVRKPKEFFICLLLISFGALGAFMSLDLFFMYIFHEVALIPTFLLIGFWGSHNRKFAATQITLYLAAGSLILLAGLFALYFALPPEFRSFDIPSIQNYLQVNSLSHFNQATIFLLLLVGFGILISLFPFHSWAPQGYAAAPPSVAMMHAGILKKFGFYGLLRVAVPFLPAGLNAFSDLITTLLIFNILYVGWVTLTQKDLGLMLGFSSVMHMGTLFLGLISMNIMGLSGLMIMVIAHGLSAALLFGLAGEVNRRTNTLQFHEVGGLASRAPVLAIFFIIGTFASIGLPGLANFAGEIMIFFGSWHSHHIAVIAGLWGVVISATYMLRAVRFIFFGESGKFTETTDLKTWHEKWPFLILIIPLFVIGFFPRILTHWIEPSLIDLLKP
jgi:NADH-quinone oxidoreductase subunit M